MPAGKPQGSAGYWITESSASLQQITYFRFCPGPQGEGIWLSLFPGRCKTGLWRQTGRVSETSQEWEISEGGTCCFPPSGFVLLREVSSPLWTPAFLFCHSIPAVSVQEYGWFMLYLCGKSERASCTEQVSCTDIIVNGRRALAYSSLFHFGSKLSQWQVFKC